MKKNAFTLIELLAVIVILAIIALIAVPIVINIMNDSKTSSDEQSVELYLDTVEKTITKKQLSNQKFNPDKCEIQDNGELECYKNNELIDTVQVEMKGKMPNKGEITILNNKFNYKNIWFNNKKYYAMATLLSDADNNNEISIGDKYTYKVNDTDTFNFYVLTEPQNGEVNLIMDRNICENGTVDYDNDPNNNSCGYKWYSKVSDNRKGPTTIIQILYNATKDWDNVPNMDLSGEKAYIDEGNNYGKVETVTNGIKITMINGTEVADDDNKTPVIKYENGQSLKTRLPRYDEVTNVYTRCTKDLGLCEPFLVDNLTYFNTKNHFGVTIDKYFEINSNNGVTYYGGYWLMSSSQGKNYSACVK